MFCPRCRFEMAAAQGPCRQCGLVPVGKCLDCGGEAPTDSDRCDKCAAPAASSSEARPSPPTSASFAALGSSNSAGEDCEGERKTITALFAEIRATPVALENLDPEEARPIVEQAIATMSEVVRRFEGWIADQTAYGIFAVFGAPIAHEDHPQRAILAALEMCRRLQRYSENLLASARPAVQGSFGVNTGEVVLGRFLTDPSAVRSPVGHPTALAARLRTLAAPGSVIVSEATRRLADGFFHFKELGPIAIKGLREPILAYQAAEAGPSRTRLQVRARAGLVRFVGRDRELSELERMLELARSSRGQLCAVMGEPGVGKSRLFHQFKTGLSGCLTLEAFALPHARMSPYLPVVELLRQYFEFTLDDDAGARRNKIRTRLVALQTPLEDTLPYVCALLDAGDPGDPVATMDRGIARKRTLEAIKRIFLLESLNRQVVLVFEDLHWLDDESLALLNVVADGIATARVLLLVNYRPEFEHDWASKTYFTRLRLDALEEASAARMLSAIVGGFQTPAALERFVVQKSQGNPFFIEELVNTLFDQGIVVRESEGTLIVTRPLSELRIPTTVQGVIASRIDRIEPAEKALLQVLAVLGTDFPLALIKRVAGDAEQNQRTLLTLSQREFIYERPSRGDVQYTFKHVLTQEVAYASMLLDRRRTLHERAAAAIEELFAHRLSDHLSVLAHHYRRAGNPGRAAQYLHLAGQQAYQRSAPSEAAVQFRESLALLDRLPRDHELTRQELAVRLSLGHCLMDVEGFSSDEVAKVFNQARELCRDLDDSPELSGALFGLWVFNFFSGRLQASHELAVQLLKLAQLSGAPAERMPANLALGHVNLCFGKFETAFKHCEDGAAAYESRQGLPAAIARSVIACHGFAAIAMAFLGRADQAVARCDQVVETCLHGAPAIEVANALICSGYVHALLRDAPGTLHRANALIEVSNKAGLALQRAWGIVQRGHALVMSGTVEEGVSQLRHGFSTCQRMGALTHFTDISAWLARGYLAAGEIDRGLETISRALEVGEKIHETWFLSELHRIRGELLMLRGSSQAEAERSIRRAIAIAAHQKSLLFELRSTVSLARLLVAQDRRDEARVALGPVCQRFSSHATNSTDLREALSLLDGVTRREQFLGDAPGQKMVGG